MSVTAHLEPKSLWKHFEEICKIPHGSGNEKAIGDYVLQVAKNAGLKAVRDETGNVIVYKKATPGHEKSTGVVLQGHLDMVNVKEPGSPHDFEKDPIRLILNGDWLKADGTTLGADNGIGVAAAQRRGDRLDPRRTSRRRCSRRGDDRHGQRGVRRI